MNLSRLLVINALATAAAGIVLFVQPEVIAGAVGIQLGPEAHFVYYLLGASELAFAALCYYGRTLTDPEARRVVVVTCIVFHAASGVAGVLAVGQGVSSALWWNVGVRC